MVPLCHALGAPHARAPGAHTCRAHTCRAHAVHMPCTCRAHAEYMPCTCHMRSACSAAALSTNNGCAVTPPGTHRGNSLRHMGSQPLVHGCAWVCMGVHGCAWVCMGVHGVEGRRLTARAAGVVITSKQLHHLQPLHKTRAHLGGACMACAWHVHGVCVACAWRARGLCMCILCSPPPPCRRSAWREAAAPSPSCARRGVSSGRVRQRW